MTRTTVDLVARVQKLLALSTSSNIHEAALARRRAQELIDRHELGEIGSAGAGAVPIDDGRGDPVDVAQRPRRWRRVLAAALADDNGGVIWSFVDDNGPNKGSDVLCFCGRASDRAVVKTLYASLTKTLEWLSASAGPNQSRQWHEAFRVGAVDVVVARAASGDEDAALVVVDAAKDVRRAAARVYADAHGLDTGVDNFLVDARGYKKGREQAQTAALPKPRRR